MKKVSQILCICILCSIAYLSNGQVSYSDNIFKIGSATPIYLGENWALEEYEDGLNFMKPSPSVNAGNYKLFIDKSGKVGIGRKPTSHFLEVAGKIWSDGIVITSDERSKNNIKDLNTKECLDKIASLNGKSYSKRESSQLEFGFLAQEVEKVFPELVTKSDNTSSINYIGLIPVIIESIQEMTRLIDEQNETILYLKELIEQGVEPVNNKMISRQDSNYLNINGSSISTGIYISYNLPEQYTNGSLHIFNLSGVKIQDYTLKESSDNITIQPYALKPGTYICLLTADGKKVDSGKMVLTN